MAGYLVGFAIGTVIFAILLRAAIATYNNMFGGDRKSTRVRTPTFGKALLIAFVTSVVNVLLEVVLESMMDTEAPKPVANRQALNIPALLLSMLASFALLSGMLTMMLPTKFGRAMAVAGLMYAIVIAIVVAAVLAMLGFALVFR
jgi:hypothetical protein